MISTKEILSFLFVITIFSLQIEAQHLIQPCNIEDLSCLRISTQNYLNATQLGIPQYDIRPIDPMHLDRLDLDTSLFNHGQTVLTNVTLHGYKNLDINQFRMNTETRSVLLETKARLTMEGDIYVQFESEEFQGTVTGSGIALISTTYNYTFVTDGKETEHFDVGKETITCTIEGQPEFIIDKELLDKANGKGHNITPTSDHQRQTVFCDIIKATYPTIMHNLRQAAKLLPKTTFFNNL